MEWNKSCRWVGNKHCVVLQINIDLSWNYVLREVLGWLVGNKCVHTFHFSLGIRTFNFTFLIADFQLLLFLLYQCFLMIFSFHEFRLLFFLVKGFWSQSRRSNLGISGQSLFHYLLASFIPWFTIIILIVIWVFFFRFIFFLLSWFFRFLLFLYWLFNTFFFCWFLSFFLLRRCFFFRFIQRVRNVIVLFLNSRS